MFDLTSITPATFSARYNLEGLELPSGKECLRQELLYDGVPLLSAGCVAHRRRCTNSYKPICHVLVGMYNSA
jgi:hypothetical protein